MIRGYRCAALHLHGQRALSKNHDEQTGTVLVFRPEQYSPSCFRKRHDPILYRTALKQGEQLVSWNEDIAAVVDQFRDFKLCKLRKTSGSCHFREQLGIESACSYVLARSDR